MGLLLRVPSLSNSLFGDELSSYFIVTGHSLGRVLHILDGHSVDLNPPLYFLSSWLVERFGESVQGLRVVSLVAGVAAIPLTFQLGRATFGWRAGLVAASVVALSPNLIFFSTEARPYALLMSLLVASTVALLAALRTGRRRWWVAYAALSCASMNTHYTAVFLLAVQFLWALWARPSARRSLIVSNLAAAISYLPWLPALVRDSSSSGTKVLGFVDPFGISAVKTDLSRWAVGHPFLTLPTAPGRPALALLAAGCVVGLVGLPARAGTDRAPALFPGPASQLALVPPLLLAMPLGLALYSAFRDSVWDERNLIASWPALGVALRALAMSADGIRARVAAGCLILAGYAVGAAKLISSEHQRPDYSAAVAFVAWTGSPNDAIVELPGPTPGPLSEVDAALAGGGPWMSQQRPVLRLGPSRTKVLREPPYARLATPSARILAREAAALARRGSLFVISYGAAPFSSVRTPGALAPLRPSALCSVRA